MLNSFMGVGETTTSFFPCKAHKFFRESKKVEGDVGSKMARM